MNVVATPVGSKMHNKANSLTELNDVKKENIWDIDYTGESAAVPWTNQKETRMSVDPKQDD